MSMTTKSTDSTAYTPPRTIRQNKAPNGWFWNYEGTTTAGRLIYSRDGRSIELNRDDIGTRAQGKRYQPWDD